jgi:hypothetical protein
VLGTPTPATGEDSVRLTPLPTRRPQNLKPKIIKVITPNPATTGTTAGTAAGTSTAKKPRVGGAAPGAQR